MSQNVSISSLLDNDDPQEIRSRSTTPQVAASTLHSLVSRYQTTIDITASPPRNRDAIVIDDDDDSARRHSVGSRKQPIAIRPTPSLPMLVPKLQTVSPGPQQKQGGPTANTANGKQQFAVGDHMRKFQTSFQLTPTPGPERTAPPPLSKTSIHSIINIDDEPEPEPPATPVPPTPAPPPKRKRAPPKKKDDKKRKPEDTPTPNDNDKKKPKPNDNDKKTGGGGAAKKKTPEADTKPVVHPGLTTEKAAKAGADVKLPPPTVVELEEDKEEKREAPIIALDIPLLDPTNPKPGQSEVVINVLRLAEEKYGWSVIHPKARSAIDIMDDMIDEDDDGMEDDDEEDEGIEDEKAPAPAPTPTPAPVPAAGGRQKKKEDEELTEEQLVRRHEVKMNRKVGKYDYEDPFIDDEELQMEEEIISTKEGFFVYWGPLVDDRNISNGGTKKTSKAKK